MKSWSIRGRITPMLLLAMALAAASFAILAIVSRQEGSRRICRVFMMDAMEISRLSGQDEFSDRRSFLCEVFDDSGESNDFLSLNVPDDLVAENAIALQGNEWFIEFESDWVNPDKKMVVPAGKTLGGISSDKRKDLASIMDGGLKENERRAQSGTIDERRLSIVRVSTADATPIYTQNELYEVLMGDEMDSFKSHINSCSLGVVELIDATDLPQVIDVTISKNIAEYTHESLFLEANEEVLALLGIQSMRPSVEHAIYVAPSGLVVVEGDGEVVGAAGYNNFMTIISDVWINAPMLLLHETSHNRGIGHAWLKDAEYGDISSVMGAPSRDYRVCFNGLHLQELGWMKDRTVVFDAIQEGAPEVIELVAFTDYFDSTDGQATVLQVGSYSLTYNRAKSFNSDVGARKDQVVIVEQKKPIVEESLSSSFVYAIDGIDSLFSGLDDAGNLLTIEVCDVQTTPDRMTLAIGSGAGNCALPATNPSTSPTPGPAALDTLRPTANIVEQTPPSTSILRNVFEPMYVPDRTHTLRADGDCDDDTSALFHVDEKHGYQRCSWLKTFFDAAYNETHSVLEAVCVLGHPATDHCEETCGMCSDSCSDDPEARITFLSIEVSCEWVSRRSFFWAIACSKEEFQVACSETCNRCGGR